MKIVKKRSIKLSSQQIYAFFAVLIILTILIIYLFLQNKNRIQISLPQNNIQIIPSITGINFSEEGKATFVYDGDTFALDGKTTVRLQGIDAPEKANKYDRFKDECYGVESYEVLNNLIKGQMVKLEKGAEDKDKYGRLLRYVFADDTLVDEFMVRNGYARVNTGEGNKKYLVLLTEAEDEARENKRGIWGSCGL